MEEKFFLRDTAYDIIKTSINAEIEDMEIILFPEVRAKTNNENIDFELREVYLYHNNGFNTHTSDFQELKGKKFIWNSEYNENDEEAGFFYVLEHENVTKGTIEILDVKNNLITFKWSGQANIFWNDEYEENVSFETTFNAELPSKKLYKIDAFKSTKTKINNTTRLEILNLDEFNEEVVNISNSRKWDQFNTILKFRLICSNTDYFGEVVFTNGKINHVTNFDDNCPLKVIFKNASFNLDVKYEEFIFEID